MDNGEYTNRDYVNKAIEHFTSIFKYYIVEMLKRAYPNGLPDNIDGDHSMGGEDKASCMRQVLVKVLPG